MNVISISGNVTKDGELRTIPSGETVLQFTVADNMIGKDKGAIFWNCSFWGKRGEAIADFVRKGQPVTVHGELSERQYVDKDGNERKVMEVRVSNVALQGGKPDSGSARSTAPRAAQPARQAPAPAGSGFDDMDDDIPF
jgi:single-strand DNA-binding protein